MDNEIMEIVAEARKAMEEAYLRYRSSGFGLMATIISLSAGGMIALRSEFDASLILVSVLFLPIFGAILQQLFHYLGEMNRARHLFDIYSFFHWVSNRENMEKLGFKEKFPMENIDSAKKYENNSNFWFHLADLFCISVVIVFFLAVGISFLILS